MTKMPGNPRLRSAQNLHQVTDADFLLSHEIEQPQAGVIAERLKESLPVELGLAGHGLHIRFDKYDCKRYIHFAKYVAR